jgi:hypothetical protein
MAGSTPAKVKIPPKPQPQQKKKKKNAPDKPQPAWLFPPDEENPVLNPKHKTNEDTIKETQERDKALRYMKRRVHSVPDRPAPPPKLLTLVGIFLSDFGFNSTSRLFTNERKARQELNGWEDAIGKKIEKGTPTLETIYRDWYREWKIKQKDETSSSESGSGTSSESDSDVELSTKQATNSSDDDDDSEASSDGLGGSDVEMKEAPKMKKGNAKNKRIPVSSSVTISSESDADDEDEKVKPLPTASKKAESTAKQAATKPTADAMINSLKRKAASSSSDSSESSLSSDEEALPQAKKSKVTSKSTTAPAVLPASPKKFDTKSSEDESSPSSSNSPSASDSESSSPPENSTLKVSKGRASKPTVKPAPVSDISESASASASNSDSDYDAPAHAPSAKSVVLAKTSGQPTTFVQAPSSDSSVTINGDSKKPSASISAASEASSATSSESSDSNSESPSKSSPKKPVAEKTKKKHEGAKQTPLAALSANVTEDSYISNKYQNYDYAERAYKDLSVTRGKGFTKEKNKKKRGSYRGGAIDTSGGKGFKFED